EDTAEYERMEQEVVDLGHAIEREERAAELEREMNASVSPNLASRPEQQRETKKGVASDAYRDAFWKHMRDQERRNAELRNALQVGELSEGGYTVPD
ncbi:MAG: phage major capsid protein, partial [Clostridia bacterium]